MKATDIIIKMWENNTNRVMDLHEYSEKTGLYGSDLKDAIKQAYEIQFEKFIGKLKRYV